QAGQALRRIPIGKPISNVRAYVKGEGGEISPAGVRGELYIGGAGLGRCYLNQPKQTAERFVPDEHGGEEGARLYRTGDIGKYRRDGEIEYIGRRDNQVKIRGYRIELGEIEGVLSQYEGVKESVVIVREIGGGGGEKRIEGYVVGEGVDEEGIKRYAKGKLAEYMVPVRIVRIEKMPVTANGKVDRRALALIGGEEEGGKKEREEAGPIEEGLLEI